MLNRPAGSRRGLPAVTSLVAFEAAARALSFVVVARELHVTPGAVSRQIQALEEHLGARLFVRHHRRVELTPLGREYLTEIGPALDRIAAVTARLRGTSRREAISICAYPTFAIRWLLPRWGRFYDRCPEIDVRLTTSLSPVDFARDDYDLAIQVLPEGRPLAGLRSEKLVDVVLFPVCSPALARKLARPEDLARQPLVHSAPRPLDWPRWLEEAGVTGVDATRGLRFESLNLAIHAAIEGLGVAMGVEALICDDLQQGRLVRPFAKARRSRQPFHLVHPEARGSEPRVSAFRAWLLEEATSAASRPPVTAPGRRRPPRRSAFAPSPPGPARRRSHPTRG